jgi:hypothetical protein
MQTTKLQDLMRAATSLTQAGKLQEATQNIQQMLKQAAGGAGLGNLGTGLADVGTAASPARPASDTVLDGYVFEVNGDSATPADATGECRWWSCCTAARRTRTTSPPAPA